MTALTKLQLATLKVKLEEEKVEIENHFEITGGDDSMTALSETTGELSSYDNHPADLATETFERGRDMAVDEAFHSRLDDIERALIKIEEGTYGACVICGDPIPYERLIAIPSSELCIEDANAMPDEEMTARPIEEQVMTPPPSGAGEGRQRDAGHFDEAGAWKLAESHGNSDSPAMAASREVTSYEQLSTDKANEDGKDEALTTRKM